MIQFDLLSLYFPDFSDISILDIFLQQKLTEIFLKIWKLKRQSWQRSKTIFLSAEQYFLLKEILITEAVI